MGETGVFKNLRSIAVGIFHAFVSNGKALQLFDTNFFAPHSKVFRGPSEKIDVPRFPWPPNKGFQKL